MINGLKKMFSPFSTLSPHSHLLPLSSELELGERLKTDIHSHLIPGIDDGAKTMKESIAILEAFEYLGYERVITTPHMMQDRYDNNHKKILDGLFEVRRELEKCSCKIKLDAAAEYYIDDQFEKLLYERDILTFSDNYILFEMSCINKPLNLFDLILEMQIAGYKPILAHPERYVFMNNDRDLYYELKDSGVLFQVDMLSLTNYPSFETQRYALWLCNNGMIDFLGSDVHKIAHLDMIEKLKTTSILKSVYDKNKLLNDTL